MAKIEPKIESAFGGVRVTFQRNNVNSLSVGGQTSGQKSVLENVAEIVNRNNLQLTERQQNIINRFVETGKFRVTDNVLENVLETSASLAKHFDVSERTIRRDLASLQSLNIIRRVGPDKGGHWEVTLPLNSIVEIIDN